MTLQRALVALLAISLLLLSACQTSSPTATMKAHFKALKAGDVAAYKKTLSSRTLARYEEAARKRNRPVDEALKEHLAYLAQMAQPADVETRGEVIDGVNATLDFNLGRGWRQARFIKEDGDWKIIEDEAK